MKKCTVARCMQPHHAKGLCSGHYARLVRTGTVGEALVRPQNKRGAGAGQDVRIRIAAWAWDRVVERSARTGFSPASIARAVLEQWAATDGAKHGLLGSATRREERKHDDSILQVQGDAEGD